MTDLTGRTLNNKFFLRQLIGSGGMADVYLAWDNQRAAKMAVKVLRRDLASNRKFYRAFEKEKRLLEELQHPNIVRLFESGQDNGIVFIVMGWVDGINLKQRIHDLEHPMDLDEVGKILMPVSSALSYAHQMNVFHCDIKPANILLHENGRDVFLADFGVARWVSERGGGGTLPYMAPEQFLHATVNAQTDIYSLGITLYQMLSGGQSPYKGDSAEGSTPQDRYAWEHINKPLPPLHEHNPSLPKSIISVVERALDKDPRNRYESAMQLWDEFARARGGRSAGTGEPTVLWQVSPVPSKPISRPSVAPKPPASPSPQPGTLHLYGRSGELAGHQIIIPKQGLTMGRGSNNQLRMQEKSVSRQHARILVMKSGIYIRDENSALGTYVNGQRIPANIPVPLKHGDIFQIGYYQIFEIRTK